MDQIMARCQTAGGTVAGGASTPSLADLSDQLSSLQRSVTDVCRSDPTNQSCTTFSQQIQTNRTQCARTISDNTPNPAKQAMDYANCVRTMAGGGSGAPVLDSTPCNSILTGAQGAR
jgi:hypothetical protein